MSSGATEPVEPVLATQEIQGIAVPGFFKPHQTLLGIVCPDTAQGTRQFRDCVRLLAEQVSNAAQTLEDRRHFRRSRHRKSRSQKQPAPLVALAFSYTGLQKLTPGAQEIPSRAFRDGLAARSAFLGDPGDPKAEGHPRNWKVGGPGRSIDALLVVAGNTRALVDRRALQLQKLLKKAQLKIVYRENGDVRSDLPGHEHFGFDDGVSQPGIRGRASEVLDDFVTERHVASGTHPEHSLYGYPGQDLVWPGVLVLGYPATSPDPLIPGRAAEATPPWTCNGSFLVFRRLRQDVGLFWRTMRTEASRLAKTPGFTGMKDETLASRIVGRWPSGAPVNRTPDTDHKRLGQNKEANNYFKFDSDAIPLPLASGKTDPYPPSKADPAGITCPWAAHIRKVNTRDSASDTGGRDSTFARRILRVGVPFGKPLKNRYARERVGSQRGLLFLGIQASIEDQFEFLVTRWMGDPSRPKMPAGHDILVGQNDAAGESRERRCTLFGSNLQQATVQTRAEWIVPTGGEYLFVPSLSALRLVLGAS